MIHPPRPSLPRATATALRLGLLCAASTCSTPLEDDPASVPFDVADGGRPGWRVRVLVGPRFPLTPGAGFAVRAENAAGQVFERTAGADGVVPLDVAREDGPWDLTVARAGCRAVSILGVAGDFDGDVYTECEVVPRFSREHAHTLFLRVAGNPDLSLGTSPSLCPGGYIQGDTPDRTRALFEYRPGMPPVDVWAVQFETMNPRARPLNVARLAATPMVDRDMTVTVTLPATPVPVVRAQMVVQFPTEGLITGASAAHAAGYESVWRETRFNGDVVPCRVGLGTWTSPDASGRALFDVEAFAPPFGPDGAGIPIGINDPGSMIVGGLRLRALVDGEIVQVPPVTALRADADGPANVRFTVDAQGYGAAYFRAYATGPNIHGEWVGFTAPGASLGGRRLPRLPSTVSLRDLTYGLSQGDRFAATACVATRRPGARPPWTPAGLDADVSLCATTPASLSRQPM